MATDQRLILIRDNVAIDRIIGDGFEAEIYLAADWPNLNLKAGQSIDISGTADYNGRYSVKEVTAANRFIIDHTENSTEATTDGIAGGDYTSLEDAESNERANLVTDDVDLVIEMYNDFPNGMTETIQVRFDTANWTTDRDHFIIIRGAPEDVGRPWIEHDGVTLRANGVTFLAGGTEHGMLHFDDDLDVFLQDFEIDGFEDAGHNGHTNPYAGLTFRGGAGGGSLLLENMRIHDLQGGGSQNDCMRVAMQGAGTTLFQWRNLVLYNTNDEGVQIDSISSGNCHPNSYWDQGVIFDAGDIGIAVTLDNSNFNLRNVYSSCPADIDFENRGTVRINLGIGCASEDSTATDLSGGSGNPTLVVAEEVLSDPAIGDMRPIHRTDGNQLSNSGSNSDLGMTDFGGDVIDQLGHGSELDINGDPWGTDRDIGVFAYDPTGLNPTSMSTSVSSSMSTTRSSSASVTASSASTTRSTTRSTSVSTTRSTSNSTTQTDIPFFNDTDRNYVQIDSGDMTEGDGVTMNEVSGIAYAEDRDYIAAVDDEGFMREYTRAFVGIQAGEVTLPTEIADAEAIVYVGAYFTDFDYAILSETTGTQPCKIILFPFSPGQTTLSSGDLTIYELSKIPRFTGQTYGNEGPEGLAFNPDTGLFYVAHQADTQTESGIWEVDISQTDTDGEAVHNQLYDWSGLIGGALPAAPIDMGKDLFDGSMLPDAFGGLTWHRSLFMLIRDTTDSRRLVVQIDRKSGAFISSFEHAISGQVEGFCFDTLDGRGDMYIAQEEQTGDVVPNIFRYSYLGPVTTSASTTKSSSVSTTRSSSVSTTKSTSRSTSASSTKSTTKSTSRSSSVSTTRSSSVSTTRSSSASTTRSSSVSTLSTTNNPEVNDGTVSDLGATDTPAENVHALVELDDESGAQLSVSVAALGSYRVWFVSPLEVPNKVAWEDGWWKVRLSTAGVSGAGSLVAQARIHRLTAEGVRISPDNNGWLEPSSWGVTGSSLAVFYGQVNWPETDFTQAPDKKDRIAVELRFLETGNDPAGVVINLGSFPAAGVDKPISINTTTTSASTTRSSSVSTTRSSSVSTSRSTSDSTTRSSSVSTTRSSSVSTTRSSSVSTTRSSSVSTTRSSSVSTTRSTSATVISSASSSRSTSRSSSVSTTRSSSVSTTRSSSVSTTRSTSRSTTRSSSVSTTRSSSVSTTRSSSVSTTRSSSVSTTRSTTKSTTRSSSVSTTKSTTRSSSVSTTRSTTKSSSVSTTKSTSHTVTASSASSSISTTRSSSVSTTRSTSRTSSVSTTRSSSVSTTGSTSASTSETTSLTSSLTTTATVPPGTPGQGPVTVPPPVDPCPSGEGNGVPVALCLHVKFIPKYNDPSLIQHGDDQISDGEIGAPFCAPDRFDLYSMWGDHERRVNPIGNAIESYQGFKTVEVLVANVLIGGETDGFEPLPGLPVGAESTFSPEGPVEGCKMLWIETVTYPGFLRFRFRLRTEEASLSYVDVFQYVYVVGHDVCGGGGSPTLNDPARCGDPGDGDGGVPPGKPPGETTATSTTTTTTTTTTTSSSTTSATTSKTTSATTSGTTSKSTTASTSASTSRSSSVSTTASTSASTSASTTASSSNSTSRSTSVSTTQFTSNSTSASTSASSTRSTMTTTSGSTSKSSSVSTSRTSSVSTTRSTSKTSSVTTTRSSTVSTTKSTTASTSASTSKTSSLTSSEATTTTTAPPFS